MSVRIAAGITMASNTEILRIPGDTATASTGDPPWVIQVRVVPPDQPRPRRWRARLRALGYSAADCRALSWMARTDRIIDGRRCRVVQDALAGLFRRPGFSSARGLGWE